MDLIKKAVEAYMPLINIECVDLIHTSVMLAAVCGHTVTVQADNIAAHAESQEHRVLLVKHRTFDSQGLNQIYNAAVKGNCSVVLVNHSPNDLIFQAGALICKKSLLVDYFKKRLPGLYNYESQVTALKGLTLKEASEVTGLCTATYHSITPDNLKAVRRTYKGSAQGVYEVSTTTPFYDPNSMLVDWLGVDGKIFIKSNDPNIVPRGLLFAGEPGCGKTQGAKYLASELGVPLLMLSVGGVMDKYYDSSERNILNALAYIESNSPCVMLLDEVEKLFKSTEDSGVTSRLLSSLLWWLEEHKSKVLTVMTTNDPEALPPELYRCGRIDLVMDFKPLGFSDAHKLYWAYLNYVWDIDPETSLLAEGCFSTQQTYPHAGVIEEAKRAYKLYYVNQLGNHE